MKLYCSTRQRGNVVVLVTIILPILLLIMGLALDFGYVFVSKTRLQNAVDAAALSAAITLGRNTSNQGAATAAGNATFNTFINSSGNSELAILAGTLGFQYGNTLNPFGITGSNPTVFVSVTSNNILQVTPMLLNMLNQFAGTIPIPARATAGLVGQNCSLVPFVLCSGSPPVTTNCYAGGPCYGGYTTGVSYTLTYPPAAGIPPSPLYFNLLALYSSQIGDISTTLQGTTNICLQSGLNTLNVNPAWSPAVVLTGLQNRFSNDTDTTSTTYSEYKTGGTGNGSRVMAVPVADCSSGALSTSIPQIGVSCVFLEAPNPSTLGQVNVEITGDMCQQNGVWDPTNSVLNGPYKIMLFKTSGSGDS